MTRLALLLAFSACVGAKDGADVDARRRTDEGGALGADPRLHVVLSVSRGTVRISGGSTAGIREGDYFVVTRFTGEYVGRIKINAVQKYEAMGVFLSASATAYAPPRPGDHATRDDRVAGVHR